MVYIYYKNNIGYDYPIATDQFDTCIKTKKEILLYRQTLLLLLTAKYYTLLLQQESKKTERNNSQNGKTHTKTWKEVEVMHTHI